MKAAGTNNMRLVLAIIACLTLSYCTTVRAETFVDNLDNWNSMANHSPELMFDTQNSDLFYGDNSRAKCSGPNPSSFYYHFGHIKTFALFGYFWKERGRIEVYASADGQKWSPVALTAEQLVATTNPPHDWFSTRITPASDLPPDTSYVGFTMRSDPEIWYTPQIGKLTITYDESVSNDVGPKGLTVVAAGSEAHLAWYPVDGASSYTVERRSVQRSEYHTIASGIASNNYTDSGLRTGEKYYYIVKAHTSAGTTGPSEEVLAVSQPDMAVFDDPLSDWSLSTRHSGDLKFGTLFGGATTLQRMGDGEGYVAYKLTGAKSFSVNVFSKRSDAGVDVSVDTSVDGTSWSPLPITLKLDASISSGWHAAVCTPDGKLPADAEFIRFHLLPGDSTGSPQIADLRLTWASRLEAGK
jgi:hypothetical protein